MAIFRRNLIASPSTKKETITDPEFGLVACRRVDSAKYVRVRLTSDGKLSATLPPRAPLDSVNQLIDESRDELRKMIRTMPKKSVVYEHGMPIGSSHQLSITHARTDTPKVRLNGQHITAWLPLDMPSEATMAQDEIRTVVKRALMKEAKAYLPRRLRYLADQYGYRYEKVRFSNAKGRWGSCSSRGTISLNIALMRLPRELIDYVLVHELCHTVQMNHSPQFWDAVGSILPDYKARKRLIKQESPYL